MAAQVKVHEVQHLLRSLGCAEKTMAFHSIFHHQKIPSPIILSPSMKYLTIQQLIHIRGLLLDNGLMSESQWDNFMEDRTIPRRRG